MKSAYRWTAGACAAAAMAFALDANCVEDRYTQPQKPKSDIEVCLDALRGGRQTSFYLPDGRVIKFSAGYLEKDPTEFLIDGIDTKLRNGAAGEELLFYQKQRKLEIKNPLKYSPEGPVSLTDQELMEVNEQYRHLFSDVANYLRRNMDIERKFKEDIFNTGRFGYTHREPIFNYSWMPAWLSKIFSRTVVDSVEKEYIQNGERVVIRIYITEYLAPSQTFEVEFPEAEYGREFRDSGMDGNIDGGRGVMGEDHATLMENLAPLVEVED